MMLNKLILTACLTVAALPVPARAMDTVIRHCNNKIESSARRHPDKKKTLELQTKAVRVVWTVGSTRYVLENYFLEADQMWTQPVIGQNKIENPPENSGTEIHHTSLYFVNARGKVNDLGSSETLLNEMQDGKTILWKVSEDGSRSLLSTSENIDGDPAGIKSVRTVFPVDEAEHAGVKILSAQSECSDFAVSGDVWSEGPGDVFERYVTKFNEAVTKSADPQDLTRLWDELVVKRDLERLPLARERRRVIAERAALARRVALERARERAHERAHGATTARPRRYLAPRSGGAVSPETRRKLDCTILRMTGDAAVPGLGGIVVGLSPYCNPH